MSAAEALLRAAVALAALAAAPLAVLWIGFTCRQIHLAWTLLRLRRLATANDRGANRTV